MEVLLHGKLLGRVFGRDVLDVLESGPRVECCEEEGGPDLDRDRLPNEAISHEARRCEQHGFQVDQCAI